MRRTGWLIRYPWRHERPAGMPVNGLLPASDEVSIFDRFSQPPTNLPVMNLSAKRPVDVLVAGLRAGGDQDLAQRVSFSGILGHPGARGNGLAGLRAPSFLGATGYPWSTTVSRASSLPLLVHLAPNAARFFPRQYSSRNTGATTSPLRRMLSLVKPAP